MNPLLSSPRNLSGIVREIREKKGVAASVAGGALIVLGAARGRLGGWLTAALGCALVVRGVAENRALADALGISKLSDFFSGGFSQNKLRELEKKSRERNQARAAAHEAAGKSDSRISVPGNRGIKIEKMLLVHRPAEELYRTWRNFENLPHFMKHLDSVRMLDGNGRRSHWIAQGPAGSRIQWDAEIINEHQNEMIAWRSLPGSLVSHAGSVRFRRLPGGTEVRVTLEYDVPGGTLGAALARLFHKEPAQEIEADLRHFKQMMESAG